MNSDLLIEFDGEKPYIKLKLNTAAGYFLVTPSYAHHMELKPNWRTRVAARILLGWRWIDL